MWTPRKGSPHRECTLIKYPETLKYFLPLSGHDRPGLLRSAAGRVVPAGGGAHTPALTLLLRQGEGRLQEKRGKIILFEQFYKIVCVYAGGAGVREGRHLQAGQAEDWGGQGKASEKNVLNSPQ